jgi:hypothetical protein
MDCVVVSNVQRRSEATPVFCNREALCRVAGGCRTSPHATGSQMATRRRSASWRRHQRPKAFFVDPTGVVFGGATSTEDSCLQSSICGDASSLSGSTMLPPATTVSTFSIFVSTANVCARSALVTSPRKLHKSSISPTVVWPAEWRDGAPTSCYLVEQCGRPQWRAPRHRADDRRPGRVRPTNNAQSSAMPWIR